MATNGEFRMVCRWCGEVFKGTIFRRYCTDVCREMARFYWKDLQASYKDLSVEEACKIHRNEESVAVKNENLTLAPVKITASATQWRWIPNDDVDRKVILIKGGRS